MVGTISFDRLFMHKLENISLLSHFLAEVSYIPGFQRKFQRKLQPLPLKISTKKKLFSMYTNHIKRLCTGNDRLISVKYWLNLTKTEN